MPTPRSWSALLLTAAALAGQEAVDDVPTLDEPRFAQLLRAVRPDARAPWRTVPWRIELLAAQREAAAAGKPLFVWAMDGHPLGCT